MALTDLKVLDATIEYEEHLFRTPIKFGGRVGTSSNIATVRVKAVTSSGKSVEGCGSMGLGPGWGWPSKSVNVPDRVRAIKEFGRRAALFLPGLDPGDPIQLGMTFEEFAQKEARRIKEDFALPEDFPDLAVLVASSPFDAAIHDAFGRAQGRSTWACYTDEFLNYDLGHYLGENFKGEYPDNYVLKKPVASVPLYHLVGALDPLTDGDIKVRVDDGHPETLEEWIRRDGLSHLKIKLNGDDLEWDIERVRSVDAVASRTAPDVAWRYPLDFNEQCPNIDYLMEFLDRLLKTAPRAFRRIEYIEQPTSRDLFGDAFDVSEAAALKPIVVDEGLVSTNSLERAFELGYTGVALKACKGQTQSLLMAAVAQRLGLFLCVQDLTCPGRAFAWSASIASHIKGVAAIEGNARQYIPAANDEWTERFPGLFEVTQGRIQTSALNGTGLGY